jgi:hypothetical protein
MLSYVDLPKRLIEEIKKDATVVYVLTSPRSNSSYKALWDKGAEMISQNGIYAGIKVSLGNISHFLRPVNLLEI